MSGQVIGVDIGVVGAIAVLSHASEFVSILDMPVLADCPTGRRSINAPLLAQIIFKSTATSAHVEHVSARPKEGTGKSRSSASAGRTLVPHFEAVRFASGGQSNDQRR
jgi:hypothetical protein